MSKQHYCPETILKKFVQLTSIVLGLEVLDDGTIFFGIGLCQERGNIVFKHKRIEEAKTRICISFLKYLQTSFLKAIQPLQWDFMPWQSEVITK